MTQHHRSSVFDATSPCSNNPSSESRWVDREYHQLLIAAELCMLRDRSNSRHGHTMTTHQRIDDDCAMRAANDNNMVSRTAVTHRKGNEWTITRPRMNRPRRHCGPSLTMMSDDSDMRDVPFMTTDEYLPTRRPALPDRRRNSPTSPSLDELTDVTISNTPTASSRFGDVAADFVSDSTSSASLTPPWSVPLLSFVKVVPPLTISNSAMQSKSTAYYQLDHRQPTFIQDEYIDALFITDVDNINNFDDIDNIDVLDLCNHHNSIDAIDRYHCPQCFVCLH